MRRKNSYAASRTKIYCQKSVNLLCRPLPCNNFKALPLRWKKRSIATSSSCAPKKERRVVQHIQNNPWVGFLRVHLFLVFGFVSFAHAFDNGLVGHFLVHDYVVIGANERINSEFIWDVDVDVDGSKFPPVLVRDRGTALPPLSPSSAPLSKYSSSEVEAQSMRDACTVVVKSACLEQFSCLLSSSDGAICTPA
ncbi:hypothetical protein HPB51_018382 [Rhipicephalus microplus]|uniref:Uncharacterized protein n=1 Tax=Rhipicephalus microplus TaxID=6941 RepID=A0A9J6EU68_RHIMP|nr:hypothetical protein HPB51_018382 [Rhipicephalus microplus]